MANSKSKKTVFVGMSGGVDSSVAAYLLKKQGYDVVGVFMRCYNVDGCAERDAEDARRVAGHLGIPFYTWDFEEEYKRRVVDYMIEGYRRGETPNPDVMCNREVKFGLFFEKARALGADFVATGHYVRSYALRTTHYALYAAKDASKDQSYFLWTLQQSQLRHCLFPIGDHLKSEVRAIAKKAGLPTAEKKDSQGICFLGEISIADFLSEYLPAKPGAVVTAAGEEIGTHEGAHFYTIGQREGIFVDGARKQKKGENAQPLYVVSKDVVSNTLVVAERDDAALRKKEVVLADVNVLDSRSQILDSGLSVFARVRYRQPLVPAVLHSTLHPTRYTLVFDAPTEFVAPGQSAVWYSEAGEMLGGGIIASSQ